MWIHLLIFPPFLSCGTLFNSELNDMRKLFVLEILKFLLKEFQFVMSLKSWWSMAYTVCHAPISMTS